jgi:hypothetical protein
MAVADVSPAYQNAVGALLEGFEDEIRRDPARAHDPNHPDIRGVLHPAHTGQISTGISAPVAAKSDNLRLKFSTHCVSSLLDLVIVQP